MSPWWEEQLAGYSPAAQLPAVYTPTAPVPAACGPPHEQRQAPAAVVDNEWHWWWNQARTTARLIARGIDPPAVDVFGPVLDQDEEAVLSADMTYSRQYGGDGRYQKADLLVVGRPAVMAAGFALSAAVNHRRKVAARREAAGALARSPACTGHRHHRSAAVQHRQGLAERLVREHHRVLSRPAVVVA